MYDLPVGGKRKAGGTFSLRHEPELGESLAELSKKPSHLVYFLLTVFGVLSSARAIKQTVEAVIDTKSTFYHEAHSALHAGMYMFLTATLVHYISIYASLIECEEVEEFQNAFKPWIGHGLEISIRFIAIVLLLLVSGEIALPLNADWSRLVAAGSAAGIFLCFSIWSSFAYWRVVRPELKSGDEAIVREAYKKMAVLRVYFRCDLFALGHWGSIIMLLLTRNHNWAWGVLGFSTLYSWLVVENRIGIRWSTLLVAPTLFLIVWVMVSPTAADFWHQSFNFVTQLISQSDQHQHPNVLQRDRSVRTERIHFR